jgi:putative transposase
VPFGDSRYLFHHRDTRYRASFLAIVESVNLKTPKLPARIPILNAYYSERWVRSAKEESLSKPVLFGKSYRYCLAELRGQVQGARATSSTL